MTEYAVRSCQTDIVVNKVSGVQFTWSIISHYRSYNSRCITGCNVFQAKRMMEFRVRYECMLVSYAPTVGDTCLTNIDIPGALFTTDSRAVVTVSEKHYRSAIFGCLVCFQAQCSERKSCLSTVTKWGDDVISGGCRMTSVSQESVVVICTKKEAFARKILHVHPELPVFV
jgi:hypothetical protein